VAIKILEVDQNDTPTSLRKKVRAFAMTGGVELSLAQGVSAADLPQLCDKFCGELEQFSISDLRRQTCSASRVLKLVASHPEASAELKARIENKLGCKLGA